MKGGFDNANYRSGDNFVGQKNKKKGEVNVETRSIEVDDVEVNRGAIDNDSEQRSTSVLNVFEFKRDSSVKELAAQKQQKNTPLEQKVVSMFDQKKR